MFSVCPTHQVQKVELNETGKKVLGEISGRLATSDVSTREQAKEVENILSDVFKNNKFVPQADHIQLKEKYKLLAHEIVAFYELEENLTSKIQKLNQVIDKLNTAKRELLAALDNQSQDNEVYNKKISMLMKKIREGNQLTESKKDLIDRVRELEMEGNVVKKAKLLSDKVINDLNLEISQLHKSKDKLLETLDKLQIERTGKQFFKYRIERDLEEYQAAHPTASKKEVWDGVMKNRLPYNGVL